MDSLIKLLFVELNHNWQQYILVQYMTGTMCTWHHQSNIWSCFIDLKKAFETVNHFILINKLRKDGNYHGNILEWFIIYLENRKQYVFYNGSKSNDQYISCGVPRGSILGSLLFILYIMIYLTFLNIYFICRRYDSYWLLNLIASLMLSLWWI